MGLVVVTASTSFGSKRNNRTSAMIFFSSSGSLSSLEMRRHMVTSPLGAMVNSSTSFPCSSALSQRAGVEAVDASLVAVEDQLDLLARARRLAAAAGARG